jgi:hypothetical protein
MVKIGIMIPTVGTPSGAMLTVETHQQHPQVLWKHVTVRILRVPRRPHGSLLSAALRLTLVQGSWSKTTIATERHPALTGGLLRTRPATAVQSALSIQIAPAGNIPGLRYSTTIWYRPRRRTRMPIKMAQMSTD